MTDLERVLELARAPLREMSALRTGVAGDLKQARECLARTVLAAAEALEIVEGSLASLVEAAGEPALAGPACLILVAAWERLEGAGVERDGAPGERIDPSRHRVVESQGPDGGVRVVARVVKAGLVLNDRRIREAWVVAGPEEGGNG